MERHNNDNSFKGNRNTKNKNTKNVKEKKPFDKKTYRLKKYSNKYKVTQWDERRKKAVIKNFYKELGKNENYKPQPNLEPNSENSLNETTNKKRSKKNAYLSAKTEYQRKKEEALQKKEEMLRKKAEREEALQNYKKKKQETYIKISKKTKKGQPVMKGRLELLLEKIQSSVR